MQRMPKKTLKELRTRLSARRNRLIKAIQRRLKECTDSGGYRLPDVIDIASLASVDRLGMLVAEAELKELKQIDDALARIESGSYGTCRRCGSSIRKDRLKALPYATLCVKCKEAEEEYELGNQTRGQGRQGETDIDFTEAEQEETERNYRGRRRDIELEECSRN
ncbi:MAG: TraR/DksA family transcriptional regulator [bacterium]